MAMFLMGIRLREGTLSIEVVDESHGLDNFFILKL